MIKSARSNIHRPRTLYDDCWMTGTYHEEVVTIVESTTIREAGILQKWSKYYSQYEKFELYMCKLYGLFQRGGTHRQPQVLPSCSASSFASQPLVSIVIVVESCTVKWLEQSGRRRLHHESCAVSEGSENYSSPWWGGRSLDAEMSGLTAAAFQASSF